MKKIVALVLSLVMVLGLATTAFAAAKPAYVAVASTLEMASDCDPSVYTYTLEKYTTGSAAAKAFDQYAIWMTNKVTGAKTIYDVYAVATSAFSADNAFIDGKNITWLADVATYEADMTLVKTVKFDDVAKCGDVYAMVEVASDVWVDVAVYENAKGELFVEYEGTDYYNDGGKAVALAPITDDEILLDDVVEVDGVVMTVVHDYDVDLKTVVSDTTVTRVFCAECKAEFAFVEGVEAMAIAKFGAGNYVDLGDGLFVAKAAGAAAPEAGDKVESAETFDAGIAMYVGMSVMAAAGSAVVLKKKD